MIEEIAGRAWRISAGSFAQPGPTGAEALVGAVARAVGAELRAGDRLIDAYCGVGLLGGHIAAITGAGLLAVESHPAAVADARRNLADLGARVQRAEVGGWRPEAGDVVIADPPRAGLGPPAVDALRRSGASRLVLVSCDPASLGRDAALLVAAGFTLRQVEVVDLFGQTFHSEAVCRFDR
jgi:tRNA/tmRNA/rRNA uracil-C5-methylase (TrmA/RlmC/RlmD family)